MSVFASASTIALSTRFVGERRQQMILKTLNTPGAEQSPWFVSWFDSIHYHRLYSYRNDAEAAEFIDAIIRSLEPGSGSAILDLGCGSGRHSKYLASKGFSVTGIDLSGESINEAKRSERPGLRFIEHDMRVPFGTNFADYVFNFFTSFGYFNDPSEHVTVIRNIADSLKAGGRLVLDYLNVDYSEAYAIRKEMRVIDGTIYRMTRWSDARHFFKRIVIDDSPSRESEEYVEQVAKFYTEDFRRMFNLCGLSLEAVYGDYRLNPYDRDESPRLILIARKGRRIHSFA
jgi:SAM-dependent methyltransferase